jgi:hypothetical protein
MARKTTTQPTTEQAAEPTVESATQPTTGETPPPAPAPTIGRTVHYVLPNGKHRPAIISEVNPDTVNLVVFAGAPDDFDQIGIVSSLVEGVEEGTEPGTWHWPERA